MDKNNIIICEKCYEENDNERTNCKNCGAKLYKNGENNSTKSKNKSSEIQEENNTIDTSNPYARAVKVIGIIEMIVGVVIGIVLGNTLKDRYGVFNFGTCVGTIVGSLIAGIFILGFGEVIQLLEDIKNK